MWLILGQGGDVANSGGPDENKIPIAMRSIHRTPATPVHPRALPD
jgi:hypothetical protein